jgi:hypothetical protein
MKMMEIKEKAKLLGLKPGRMKKADLIRAVQMKEGNFVCFATNMDHCDQTECCWKEDCLN